MTDTVLIVDDDPVQRRLLDAMLKRFGYDVASAENGDAEGHRRHLWTCGGGEPAGVKPQPVRRPRRSASSPR